ncbi:uncharacterized protein LOC110457303 [Mizuhopecten yessoensis]|uniref:Uncharacterized protein n=1 Tax=Mizuhopecten yessoensis TaxID=6573 RepID=A0A210Q919_MIZYE|nr:uncharacterized protein LOC110457303 [Mizuhopecten yessoensis]XP_021364185.1 uncharacterized protein LOC110457303 [Mizuhopecten yessoensis]OWF45228.1 hypothetical protein KP79_PYT20911 [Mizuhopecten yessoensis]
MANILLAATIVYILSTLLQFCQGQICKYHHLHADCYYRIDGICLSHITVDINQCDDPISLDLSIDCKNPAVDWKETFSMEVERRMVGGFDKEVFITVQQGYTDNKKYRVNIDFISERLGKVHFMDEKLDLITEGCTTLNGAAKVAVGVLVPLLVLAIVALVVIIIIRRRQRRKQQLTQAMLVNNLEGAGSLEPPVQLDSTDATQDSSSSSNTYTNGEAVVFSQLPQTLVVNENPTC